MNTIKHLTATIPTELSGLRLDQALAKLFPEYSRSRLQEWIKNNQVTVDHEMHKAKAKVFSGQKIEINATIAAQENWQAQEIALDIIYEDNDLIIINKPPGLVVHPGAGNPNNTLVNALLHHAPELNQLPRAGMIHRIDKDTSGLLVFARSDGAYTFLVRQMQKRLIKREYLAVVIGLMISGGTVDLPIGRHPTFRMRMTVLESGKPAVTHYRVSERFQAHTLLKVTLETGRTHQIRVHMAQLGYPVLGDQLYNKRLQIPKGASEELRQALTHFKRQALHAQRLTLTHPQTNEVMTWEAPMPQDMQNLIEILRSNK